MSTRKKSDPILVVTIKENVVDEARLFTNVKRAQEAFTIAAMDLGARKDFMDALLDDGYYQAGDLSVCLTHPEVING